MADIAAQRALEAEPEVKVVSFREDKHCFPIPADVLRQEGTLFYGKPAPKVLQVDAVPRNDPPLWGIVRWGWCFIAIHNMFAGPVAAAVTALVWWAFSSWAVRVALLSAWGLYIMTLFDRKEPADCRRASIWTRFQRSWLWTLTHEWGYMEVVRLAKLDAAQNYIFGFAPHGVMLHSRLTLWGPLFAQLFPGLDIPRILAASQLFSIPGSREMCLWLGAIDARRSSARRCLQTKTNCALYPGGVAEILTSDPNSKATTLLSRRGFIRLALETGTPIVPVFVFGEKHMYRWINVPAVLARALYMLFQFPLIVFAGYGWTWVPLRRPLTVVYGRPIAVPVVAAPTEAEVAGIHAQFMAAQRAIFDTFRQQVGYAEDEHLVFVDMEARKRNKKSAAGAGAGAAVRAPLVDTASAGAATADEAKADRCGSEKSLYSPSSEEATSAGASPAAANTAAASTAAAKKLSGPQPLPTPPAPGSRGPHRHPKPAPARASSGAESEVSGGGDSEAEREQRAQRLGLSPEGREVLEGDRDFGHADSDDE